jgi:hypothetical protein
MKYRLFKSLVIIDGFRRSIILDPKRNEFKYIPKDMSELLINGHINFEQLKETSDKEVVTEYFNFLNENEYVYPETLDSKFVDFIDRSTELSFYDLLSSAHFIVNDETELMDFKLIIRKLSEVFYCDHFSISFKNISEINFGKTLSIINDFEPVYLKVDGELSINYLKIIEKQCESYVEVINEFAIKTEIAKNLSKNISYRESNMVLDKHHPIFKMGLNHYNLSLTYNSFFFRKIWFDDKLNHTSDKSLLPSSVNQELNLSFQNVHQNKTKQRTLVCRDCEHRQICYDSRVPIQSNTIKIWTFERECSYNPYIAKWESDKGYETVQESINKGIVREDYVNRVVR